MSRFMLAIEREDLDGVRMEFHATRESAVTDMRQQMYSHGESAPAMWLFEEIPTSVRMAVRITVEAAKGASNDGT